MEYNSKISKITVQFRGTLQNEHTESVETTVIVKLKEPIDMFKDGFDVYNSVIKSINDEMTHPVVLENYKKQDDE